MQLLKPVWVTGDGQAFMSIDIHPDGTRFATGGQGEDCGRVSIWSIKPILDDKAAKDKDVPKLLTQMDHHLGCVNCVRRVWDAHGFRSEGVGYCRVMLSRQNVCRAAAGRHTR